MLYTKLIKLYREGFSLRQLGEKFGISHMQVKRILDKTSEPIRDSSEAQANYLKRNPDKHPTKGKKRTLEERLKISKAYTKYLEPEERERRKRVAKEAWENKSKEEKEKVRQKTFLAFRNTSRYGSKLERFLVSKLSEHGFGPEFHKQFIIENDKMHVDIYLPEKSIAIEIDGPSHYEPIFGPEALEKTQQADTEKNGLLLARGITVIRIKQTNPNPNQFLKYKLFTELEEKIKNNVTADLIRMEI